MGVASLDGIKLPLDCLDKEAGRGGVKGESQPIRGRDGERARLRAEQDGAGALRGGGGSAGGVDRLRGPRQGTASA